ncbi:MAG: Beta-galactosidase [Lentisphaerae bacterium ADurb.Bin242]|nr:MAG: Beta-galactosidase [Lentisphaerae bacterium ADurb.Bin242]
MIASFDFNKGWKFIRGFSEEMLAGNYDDSSWRTLDLPHDWSIENDFDIDSPTFCRGAWLPGGMGCYRKRFTLPEDFRNHDAALYFGGIYRNSEIWVNGHYAGGREWGFISFETRIGKWLDPGGINVVAVKVDNSVQPSCRWYSGSGIYRNVELVFSDRRLEIPRWGMYVLACNENISEKHVEFYLKYELHNKSGRRLKAMVSHRIKDADGAAVYEYEAPHTLGTGMMVTLADTVRLDHPRLWSPESPHLYRLQTNISLDGRVIDTFECNFGLRSVIFDADKGCFLNGRHCRINGFALHADGGALGSAVSKKSYVRQLRILKEFGCNAVRTAHNPPGEDFLEACDELGLLVLDEAFDEWQEPIRIGPFEDGEVQTTYARYYSEIFDRCSKQDLTDFVKRDRNHPSVFMWCIGNEIPQMHKPTGGAIARRLVETVHRHDEMRPVTSAVTMDDFLHENIDCLDIGGYNYPRGPMMDMLHAKHPGQPMILTENHSVRSMLPPGMYLPFGERPDFGYRHPGAVDFIMRHADLKLGVEQDLSAAARPYVMGHFVWTGFDYLGEPTPCDWPAHSSFYGVFTTAGFPKDAAYYYRYMWRKEIPGVRLCTNWDYRPGDKVEVKVLSNCPVVELFLNGRSLGAKAVHAIASWLVSFEPGELSAKAYRDNSNEVSATDAVHTSGKPAVLRLTPYFGTAMKAGSLDLEYIACELFDEAGHPVRMPMIPVAFRISGAGHITGVDNGYPMEEMTYQRSTACRTCDGRCLCIVKPGQEAGILLLEAEAGNCRASLALRTEEQQT